MTVHAAPAILHGIDVSRYQGAIDWKKVRASGIRFAFVRVSQGVSYVDPMGHANLAGATEAGVDVGAYHYLDKRYGGPAQAEHFLKCLNGFRCALPAVVDVEEALTGEHPLDVARRASDWIGAVKKCDSLVYTFPAFASRYLSTFSEAAAHPLWIAHWGVASPIVPRPWTRWTIWQKASNGRIAGIRGPVDLNVMREEDYSALLSRPATAA